MPDRIGISIVIPVFNSQATIVGLVDRLVQCLGTQGIEIVLVNDGSVDDSHAVCRHLAEARPAVVRYMRLSRNFGEHNAVMAGLHHVQGDYAVIMDDDCQNPPEEVTALVAEAQRGDFDVVYSVYEDKKHSWGRNLGSRAHNWMATHLLNKPADLYLSSFKCINRFTVNEVIRYTGPFPYIDGLILRCTRNIGRVQVRHEPRREGTSGYSLGKLIRLWLNMFLNFSITPLRLCSLLGVLVSVVGLSLGASAAIEKFYNPNMPLGWAQIMVVIVTLSSVQLVMLGLLGEYMGSMFLSQNRSPQFVVRDVYGASSHSSKPHGLAGGETRAASANRE